MYERTYVRTQAILIVKIMLMLLVKRNDDDGEGGRGEDGAGT